MLMANCCRKIF